MLGIAKNILQRLHLYSIVTRLYDWTNIKLLIARNIVRVLTTANKEGVFVFIPYYHTGGAEKVHLEIVNAIKDKHPWVIFTLPSSDNCFKNSFSEMATCFELYPLIKHKHWLGNVFLQALIFKINQSPKALAFGGNCMYFYSIIPKLRPTVKCIDLIHAFVHKGEIGVEYESLPLANRINQRITINEKTKANLALQYQESNLSPQLNERVITITNKVNVPAKPTPKSSIKKPNIVFVSRNSPEKRIHLAGKLSSLCWAEWAVKINFIGGGLSDAVLEEDKPNCTFLGNITDEVRLSELYSNAHILILTSDREGMPLVIMEAMAHNVVCLSTNVGGIAEHLKEDYNGYLIENASEEQIVKELFSNLSLLHSNPEKYQYLSTNSFEYARQHFTAERFNREWKHVFEND